MKKLLAVVIVAFSLGGCAAELARFQDQVDKVVAVTQEVAGLKVSAKSVVVISNSFNTIKAGATQYLIYCKTNLERNVCSADNRRLVIKNIDLGTKLRDQLQEAARKGDTAAGTLFNALKSVIATLAKSPAAESFGVAQ